MPAGGVTYLPIPRGSGAILPGLISVDLPLGIRKGETFDIVVRQVTGSGRQAATVRIGAIRSWRRVLGSFQIKISVTTKDLMLAPEERSLSVMRRIQEAIPAGSRWFAVTQRHVNQIAARVGAFGGNRT
jgi:hypothetical protein